MGNDKVSFEDRVAFADAHLDDVFDSADKPLEGRRWWMSADSPWQCLATCLELTAALRSPNPKEFMSRLPIHQDGSCNGLQHYAALGGDLIGAQQVNMTRSEKPQDVYSGVARKVLEFTLSDAKKGVPEALLMKDRINRKLVKQTVMTNTYGVTFIGARKQVHSRLREARASRKVTLPPLTDPQMDACSRYITLKIFESMSAMFSGAREIQTWLNSTAGLIARSITPEDIPLDELELTEEVIKLGIWKDESEIQAASGSIETEEEPSDRSTVDDGLLSSVLKDSSESLTDKEQVVEPIDESPPSDDSTLSTSSLLKKRPPVFIPPEKRIPIKMTSVIWTTPLGLPVVQPYRNWKGQVVCFFLCGL
jgi:DNA-directed RNA polymerase